ncbi:hypothetical protein [Photobacterium sp. J15]|nr:hypothetical protein [Photobacterium sp. J15]
MQAKKALRTSQRKDSIYNKELKQQWQLKLFAQIMADSLALLSR